MGYKTYHDRQPNMDDFLNKYSLSRLYVPPEIRIDKKKRIPKKDRICRFCNQGYQHPGVTFNNESHIIPELFGSNFGVSDYECDSCNSRFSRYESHLAHYLGLIRTVLSVGGKKNIPTFKSPGDSLIARMSELNGEKKAIAISDNSRSGFNINTTTGVNTITYTKNPYTPINVYKALLKIALTILPEKDVKYYKMMFDFISSEDNHEAYVQCAKVLVHTTNNRVENAGCYLFKKNNADDLIPTHIFKLYFENFIYQFFIPYHINDRRVYQIGQLTPVFCPPILEKEEKNNGFFNEEFLDFTSTSLIKGQVGKVVFRLDPEIYKKIEMYDSKTNNNHQFKPEKIVKISIYKVKNTP